MSAPPMHLNSVTDCHEWLMLKFKSAEKVAHVGSLELQKKLTALIRDMLCVWCCPNATHEMMFTVVTERKEEIENFSR